MYTFNLLPLNSTLINVNTNNSNELPKKLTTELCSINDLKTQIAQILLLPNDSFGRQLSLIIEGLFCFLQSIE